jgi:hypothetical protein
VLQRRCAWNLTRLAPGLKPLLGKDSKRRTVLALGPSTKSRLGLRRKRSQDYALFAWPMRPRKSRQVGTTQAESPKAASGVSNWKDRRANQDLDRFADTNRPVTRSYFSATSIIAFLPSGSGIFPPAHNLRAGIRHQPRSRSSNSAKAQCIGAFGAPFRGLGA